ncbi:MAG: Gfo/Idh/MocA family protein [Chakrabartia sp.]
MDKQRIALIGYGQIARTEHAPAIAASNAFEMVAAVTTGQDHGLDIPVFPSTEALLAADLGLDAAAICTPPAARHAIACRCLDAGLHLLLEKPTASTLGEAQDIAARSHLAERTAFATWHARHHPSVNDMARRIAEEGLASLHIVWREDVTKWHPDQSWIWQPGGFGVFDPGINALSIATRLLDAPFFVRAAALTLHEAGQQPIAATLRLAAAGVRGPILAEFDWRPQPAECWTIRAITESGTRLVLDQGGRQLEVDGQVQPDAAGDEYAALYARFAELIVNRRSDMDIEPLRLVADALLVAERMPAISGSPA